MKTLKRSGNGLSKQFLPDVEGMIVLDPGTTTTLALAKTAAGWGAHINPDTSAAIAGTYVSLRRGIEDKTTAPEFTTSNTGYKEKTKDFAWEYTGYALMSYADYKTWFEADGVEYDFVLVLADGNLLAPLDSAGNVVGFSGTMFVNYGMPKPGGDGKQKACIFDVMLDNIEQMKSHEIIETSFKRRELEELVPVGINLDILTPYDAGTGIVVVKATHRVSGTPFSLFATTAEWKVVSLSTDAGGACTICTATLSNVGIYTLTFKNSTAVLTGDFEIQAELIQSTHVTYLSNVINIPV